MTSAQLAVPGGTVTPYEALSRVLAGVLARDRQPPCCDGTGRWLSEDADLREQAVTECADCPLTEPCRAAGESETWGVWGVQDVSVRPSRRRRPARREEMST